MSTQNIRLGLIGAGRMGSFHGLTAARHIPGACLAAIADPVPGQAARLAAELGVDKAYTDPQELVGRTALKRMGSPADIAAAALYLLRDAPYVTGQIITVDGGRSLVI